TKAPLCVTRSACITMVPGVSEETSFQGPTMSTRLKAAHHEPTVKTPETPLPGASLALSLLLLINLFNYVDRQLLVAMLPRIEESLSGNAPAFAGGPENANKKLGALSTAFMLSFLAASLLVGWLAERLPRWSIVGVGVILWSLASGATGLADLFLVMLVTR